MLLPFVAWAITGTFFFFKPGYKQAYEKLSIVTYPNISQLRIPEDNKWSEIKVIRSVIGDHLLIKQEQGHWVNVNKNSLNASKLPTKEQIQLLVKDATKHNKARYGYIQNISNLNVITSTDITITLDWNNMSLSQSGRDTKFINAVYNVHYLRWTGIAFIDKFLGLIGLLLVLILAILGCLLSFKSSKNKITH